MDMSELGTHNTYPNVNVTTLSGTVVLALHPDQKVQVGFEAARQTAHRQPALCSPITFSQSPVPLPNLLHTSPIMGQKKLQNVIFLKTIPVSFLRLW